MCKKWENLEKVILIYHKVNKVVEIVLNIFSLQEKIQSS
jgi:hypothetical protein